MREQTGFYYHKAAPRHRNVQRLTQAPPPRQQHTRPQPVYEHGDYELGDDEDWEEAPIPVVTRRYTAIPQGARIQAHPDQVVAAPKPRRQVQVHWLIYVGLALLFMLMSYVVFANLGAWWQIHQDDSTYGMPRTYQTDSVVGHNDSNSNPSHFIAENLRGHIIVTEYPGGAISKARVYPITSEAGGDASVPVKLTFQDVNDDGKLDMIVQVGDQPNIVTFTLYNDGTQFKP